MRKMIVKLQNNEHFCTLAYEDTDNSKAELLSFVFRQVTEGLEVKEYFLGFHRLNNTRSDHVAHVIKVRNF